MSIWMSACEVDMITLNGFYHLYCLKPSTHHGYFEILPWDRKSRVVSRFPSSFRDWKSWYFFVFGSGWVTMSNDLWVKSRGYYGNGKFWCLVRIYALFS